MAVAIRMKRMGTNNRLQFRIVAADSRSPRDGRFLETLGHYDPTKDPAKIKIDENRLAYWVKNGAQVSPAVKRVVKQWKKTKSE